MPLFRSARADAETALAMRREGAYEFAEQVGARMIATLAEVRTTADSAADEARLTLEKLVSGARDAMQATATGAIDAAFKNEVIAQLTAIEEASARAVAAPNGAADRDRKRAASGQSGSLRVDLGGRLTRKKKNNTL